MSLFKIFHSPKLQVSWTFQSKDIVWRLLPTASNLLIGEARNPVTKHVSFFCINAQTGTPLWQNLTFKEQWWIGLEGIHRDVLFIHEFATPELPDHKKVYALNAESGEQLWVNNEVQFIKAAGDAVYVAKMGYEERQFFEIDLKSGALLKELSFKEVSGVQAETDSSGENIRFPLFLEKNDSVGNLLKGINVKDLVSSVYTEYIERGEQVIVGYYFPEKKSKQQPALNQYLTVHGQRGRQVYEDILNAGISYPTPDGFLCINDTLLYVRNKNELVAVNL